MNSLLNVLIFGAGAVGTYIGGSLSLSGNKVVFLERPEVAAELSQRGLRLRLNEQENHLASPRLASSIQDALQAGPYDLALFALKSYDTQNALDDLLPYRQAMPPILCLQNGVENETAIATALGDDKMIPGTLTSAIGRRAAGDVVLERLRGVGIGAGHPLVPRLVDEMNRAGLNAQIFSNIPGMKWSKMLTNLMGNATSAILDMTPSEVFAHAGLYHLEITQLREALRVMRAQEIKVVNLPKTPVRLLAFGVLFLPPGLSRPLLARAIGSGRGGKMPSFHIDLHSGRGKSEVDYLNGAVVRFGKQLGIPTPANRLLNEILLGLTTGERSKVDFARKPEKLLNELQKDRIN